jgi:hypothetical protein
MDSRRIPGIFCGRLFNMLLLLRAQGPGRIIAIPEIKKGGDPFVKGYFDSDRGRVAVNADPDVSNQVG